MEDKRQRMLELVELLNLSLIHIYLPGLELY